MLAPSPVAPIKKLSSSPKTFKVSWVSSVRQGSNAEAAPDSFFGSGALPPVGKVRRSPGCSRDQTKAVAPVTFQPVTAEEALRGSVYSWLSASGASDCNLLCRHRRRPVHPAPKPSHQAGREPRRKPAVPGFLRHSLKIRPKHSERSSAWK